MKKNNIVLIIICSLFAIACKKNELRLTNYSLPQDKAYIRFAFLSPGTPSVMVKINNVKINGSNTLGLAGFFPSVSNSPDYAAVPPNGDLKLSLQNTGTGNDSVVVYTGKFNVDAGKFYSVVLADTGRNRTLFQVSDNPGPLVDSANFRLRVINAMPNATISLVRVDSTSATVVVRDTLAKNIAFRSASDFIKTGIGPKTGYSFLRFRTINEAGNPLASLTPPSVVFSQRAVTTYASGFDGGTLTLAPSLSTFIFNK